MAVSEFEGDYTVFRDQYYRALRSSFISDDGDSTFPVDDASTQDAPEVSAFQAILWAIATCAGMAEEQLERAGSNRNPGTAQELLGLLEQDYQVIPAYGSSISDRQAVLALRARIARGSSRPAIEAALTEMLGADFVAYETNDDADAIVTWPEAPQDVGIFDSPNAERKIFRLLSPVTRTGAPVTVGYSVLGGSSPPIAGELYCCDPDARSPNIERIQLTAVTAGTLTATFTKPHEAGTLACRPHPIWSSNQRSSRIVLTFAAATDTTIRAKVNDYLSRALRGVSQWQIVSNEGSFILGHATRGILGATGFGNAVPSGAVYAAGASTPRGTAAGVGSSVMTGAAAGSSSSTSTAAANSAPAKAVRGAVSATSNATATSAATKASVGSAAARSTGSGFKG